MIRLVVLEVDGVLTDGTLSLSKEGNATRRFALDDFDAIRRLVARGIAVDLIMETSGSFPDLLGGRLSDVGVHRAGLDKLSTVIGVAAARGVPREAICYVGHGFRDVPVLRWARLGMVPAESAPEVRAAARVVLNRAGGTGIVSEVEDLLAFEDVRLLAPVGSPSAGDVVALIPVRAGSRRLPNKNLRQVGGQSLLAWAIQHALRSQLIETVYVSTDSPRMAARAVEAGASVPFLRPRDLATDDARDVNVFRHFLSWYGSEFGRHPELVVQVRATCPIRDVDELDEAIALMLARPDADSLRSVARPVNTPYKMWRQSSHGRLEPLIAPEHGYEHYDGPTQGLPQVWVQDGFVDIIRPRTVLQMGSMAGTTILGHSTRTPPADIDDVADLRRVSRLLLERRFRGLEPAPIVSERLGILQGRLTESPPGHLQWFPESNWAQEFETASRIGLAHIEWLLQRGDNAINPLWSQEGRARMRSVSEGHGVALPLLCVDSLLDSPLADEKGRPAPWLSDVMVHAQDAGISDLVLPLMEASDPARVPSGFPAALESCERLAQRLDIRLHLEVTARAEAVISLVERLDSSVVGVCFDPGNLKAAGLDAAIEYRALAPRVTHVHLKDVAADGHRTLLGEGTVDLVGLMAQIIQSGYAGRFTLETPRGRHPGSTAAEHRSLFLRLARQA